MLKLLYFIKKLINCFGHQIPSLHSAGFMWWSALLPKFGGGPVFDGANYKIQVNFSKMLVRLVVAGAQFKHFVKWRVMLEHKRQVL